MNLLFGVRYKKQARNIDIDVYICYNVEYKG